MGHLTDDDFDRWDDERVGRPTRRSFKSSTRADELRALLERTNRELVAIERQADRFGDEPPVGTVVTFTKVYPSVQSKTYSYAALRVGPERVLGAGWYLTGRDKQPRDWNSLCEFIGDNPFRVIPPEGGKSMFFEDLGSTFFEKLGHAAPRKPRVWVMAEADAGQSDVASVTEQALARLCPFIVGREPNAGRWQVLDEREPVDSENYVVRTFSADEKGERRARVSARARNIRYREQVRALEVEPPEGARVRSVANPQLWALRQSDGWVRYHGDQVQAVRLSWHSVQAALHVPGVPTGIIAGTPTSPELFGEPGHVSR